MIGAISALAVEGEIKPRNTQGQLTVSSISLRDIGPVRGEVSTGEHTTKAGIACDPVLGGHVLPE